MAAFVCMVAAVKLVDVRGAEALRQTVVVGMKSRHCLAVLFSFINMALMKPRNDLLMDLLRKMQPTLQFGEFRGDDFLANIGLTAFTLVAGAVAIHVAPFMDLADQGAAAVSAIHEA